MELPGLPHELAASLPWLYSPPPPPPPPGRTSLVPDGTLEPPGDEAAPRERGKAPPAKKMKVGDYVCIHSGLLGQRHLPCRIVRNLGNHYQLYCPKGVLTNSLSGGELDVPPSKCGSIPLHGWRQAPRKSTTRWGCYRALRLKFVREV